MITSGRAAEIPGFSAKTIRHYESVGLLPAAGRTVATMRQTLGFALVFNALGVPLAAGVLYPAFGLLLSPLIATLATSLSSVGAVKNALRLRTK